LLALRENMRLRRPNMSDAERDRVADFAKWLLHIGDGIARGRTGCDTIAILPRYRVNTPERLLANIYPGLDCPRTPEEAREYF
jgi:hypothetical protein